MNRKPKLAPRNPLVLASAMKHNAGRHGQSFKAQRRDAKQELKMMGRSSAGQSKELLPPRSRVRIPSPQPSEISNTWHCATRGDSCLRFLVSQDTR